MGWRNRDAERRQRWLRDSGVDVPIGGGGPSVYWRGRGGLRQAIVVSLALPVGLVVAFAGDQLRYWVVGSVLAIALVTIALRIFRSGSGYGES